MIAALAAAIIGVASVIDGDTLEVHGQRIRLFGVDAPESRQLCTRDGKPWRCGQSAALALSDHLGSRAITCFPVDRDRCGRVVAKCNAPGDLGRWLVLNGWALDYWHYSHNLYSADQLAAQKAKRGVWAGEVDPPWQWRREHPR